MKPKFSTLLASLAILLSGLAFWSYSPGPRPLKTEGVPITFLDKRTLAIASPHAIQLWDAETGTLNRTIELATQSAGTGVFSPDHKIWASPKEYREYEEKPKKAPKAPYNTVFLFGTKTGSRVRTLTATGNTTVRGGEIYCLAFSPDGKTLAGGSSDYTARLWDVASGRLLHTVHTTSEIHLLTFSPDGKTLATATMSSGPEMIRLWNTKTGKLKRLFREPVGPSGFKFSSDNSTLLCVCMNGNLHH